MTNKQKAQDLLGVVLDKGRRLPERKAAADGLQELKRSAKVAWDKLGITLDDVRACQSVTSLPDEPEAAPLAAERRPADARGHGKSSMPAIGAGIRAILGGASASQGARVAASLAPTEGVKRAMEDAAAKLEAEDFEATEEELAAQSGRRKPPEDAPTAPTEPEAGPTAAGSPKATDRGRISALVRRLLLDTELTYSAIVEAVRAEHPEAKTSARSVASTAADMRRAKLQVRERRVPAAAK